MLAETGRLPIDNPSHPTSKLTMIHEAMVLEYSGRYLALIEWALPLKLLVFFILLGNLFVPWGLARALTLEAVMTASWRPRDEGGGPGGGRRRPRDAGGQAPALPGARAADASFVLALLAVTSSFLLR